jgi:hypothetical protein
MFTPPICQQVVEAGGEWVLVKEWKSRNHKAPTIHPPWMEVKMSWAGNRARLFARLQAS